MRAVIDTNVLVYDTFEDSVYHSEAKELLDALDEWIIPLIVIHEYVWLMKSLSIGVDDVVYKVEEYIEHKKTRITKEEPEDIVGALERVRREKLRLSRYNDEVLLSVAAKIGILATFDKKLRNQAEALKVRTLPDIVG